MATVYVDDYSGTATGISKLVFQKTNENTSNIQSKSEWFVFAILFTVLLICIVTVVLSVLLSKKYTNKIISLSESCKNIAEGDFTSRVKSTSTNDELEDLSLSIEYMRENINRQAETIKTEIKRNEEKNKELGEALTIAEEKTKQLISHDNISNNKV